MRRANVMAKGRGAWLLMAIGLLASCSPGGDVDVDSSKFLIYDLDRETGEYRLTRVKIDTLTNVSEADGEVVYLQGGGNLTTPVTDPQTREEWLNVLAVEGANTPHIEYTVDRDGTVVPWDFDSAMMLTVYHHFEAAAEYFDTIPLDDALRQDLGKAPSELVDRVPCYYYPTVGILGIPIPVFTDNAAYAFTMNAFLVPPRRALDEAVPIYANRGVLTHEYSHAMFNRLVHNGAPVPDHVFERWNELDETTGLPVDDQAFFAYNELSGLDEGVADIFAALDTKDPNFIAASISEELIDRDMAKPRYYEQCLLLAAQIGAYPPPSSCGGNYPGLVCSDSTDPSTCTTEEFNDEATDSKGVRFDYAEGVGYDSHHLGAVVASVFWALRDQNRGEIDDNEWGRIMVKTLRDIQDPDRSFRVTRFFDALHDNLPAASRGDACALFKERLIAIQDELQCQP